MPRSASNCRRTAVLFNRASLFSDPARAFCNTASHAAIALRRPAIAHPVPAPSLPPEKLAENFDGVVVRVRVIFLFDVLPDPERARGRGADVEAAVRRGHVARPPPLQVKLGLEG